MMSVFCLPFAAMASRCEVMVAADSPRQAEDFARPAVDEVARIERKYSRYRADSIVSRLNAAAGAGPVECDEETRALFDYADSLYQASGGLFDITSGVLRRAWDFRAGRVPSAAELAPLRALIGWPDVERDGAWIRLPRAGMEIDLGGFGKEYAADRAAEALAAQGARHGYIDLAGDMRVIGPKPDGQPWQIGIQHPREPQRLAATIPVERGGLATSGDYERFFERDGRRYCHILDPHSGQPVSHWQTVSVVAPMAVVAGNCTTIAMLKQADGLDFLRQTGLSFFAIDRFGESHWTTGSAA